MGCTILADDDRIVKLEKGAMPMMKVRPQYLGCIMMSLTGIKGSCGGSGHPSLEVPRITEYSRATGDTEPHLVDLRFSSNTMLLPPPRMLR